VLLYPGSGTGAWESSLVNVLSPGDRALTFNFGQFSAGYGQAARNLGYQVDEVPLRWGQTIPAEEVEARLRADDPANPYRAVLVVHNETATGVTADIAAIRGAMDAAGHDALLLVDAVSSLGSLDVRFDEWRIDVATAASQKGLMLPPGMGIVCASPRAIAIGEKGGSPRHFFDWRPVMRENAVGLFPYTPNTLMLFGLRESLAMLFDESLPNVFARHHFLAEGVRAAVAAWGLSTLCEDPRFASDTITAVAMPEDMDSNAVVRTARDRFSLSLGLGLGRLNGKAFRIGHLGSLNELEVLATLAGVEMTLAEVGIPLQLGSGVAAAQQRFTLARQAALV
jgi:alanine-glyoxylate transaminase/serine-glyoxylate transaminase/serine-pyruvate transaminase